MGLKKSIAAYHSAVVSTVAAVEAKWGDIDRIYQKSRRKACAAVAHLACAADLEKLPFCFRYAAIRSALRMVSSYHINRNRWNCCLPG